MSIQEFENKCFKELNFLYSDQEINSLCKYAYQEYFGTNWPSEILDKSQEIINEKQELFENYLNQFFQEIPEDADQAERLSQGVWDADSCSKRPMRSSN